MGTTGSSQPSMQPEASLATEQVRSVTHRARPFLPREVPKGLEPLTELALDLRWTWCHGCDALWREIDADAWEGDAMNVEDAMAKHVWTCRAGEPLSCAVGLMWDHDIGAAPVVNDEGKLVGIVTDRDACMATYFTGRPMAAVSVELAMSKVVYTVEPGHSLRAAENLMRAKQIRRLPVVDGDYVVGMITLGDLARATTTSGQVTANEVNATLASIVEPRVTSIAAAA